LITNQNAQRFVTAAAIGSDAVTEGEPDRSRRAGRSETGAATLLPRFPKVG
jgi:hypothetical protein